MIVINTKLATCRRFIVENLVQCKALGEFKNNNSHQEKNLSYASAQYEAEVYYSGLRKMSVLN
jgi:hypothetical protein